MGALPEKPAIGKKSSSSVKTYLTIVGVLGAIAAIGLIYMTVYVSPEEVVERVKVIAVADSGCIVETFDGFAFNIGQCNAQPGDFLMAPVDQKVKERALAMNPS